MHPTRSTPAALLLALISSTTAQESSSSRFSAPRPMEQSLTTTITDISSVVPSEISATVTALSGTRTESADDEPSLTPIIGTNTNAEPPSSGSTTVTVLSTSSSSSSSTSSSSEEETATETSSSTTTMVGDPGNAGQTGLSQSQTTQNAGMPVMGVGVQQAVMLGLGAGAAFVV